MKDIEVRRILQRCAEEIKQLRRVIDNLRPKADAYDKLAIVLELLPRRPEGMSEDLVWRLEKKIEELSSKPEESAEEPNEGYDPNGARPVR